MKRGCFCDIVNVNKEKQRRNNTADQDWIGLMIFKNFADQDWIGLNLIGQDWTRTKKFHSPLISVVLCAVF